MIQIEPILAVFRPGASLRRRVSLLGIVLVLFNLVASGLLPAGAAPVSGDDRILVCTTQGMVVLGADGKPSPADERAASHTDLCAFCLPLMHAGGEPQAVSLAFGVHPALDAGSFAAVVQAPMPPARPEGVSSPRAPPLL